MRNHAHAFCSIVPPQILEHMAKNGRTPEEKDAALRALALTARLRGRREALAGLPQQAPPPGQLRRTIFDANKTVELPGHLVRSEGQPASKDADVNRAYDGSGATYDFYEQVLGRNSIDGHGMRLDSTVHYDVAYANAFWNGSEMIYGDGDGRVFGSMSACVDVIGHELTHGVTEHTANLVYRGQSGALNESFSDVFGILVKQWLAQAPPDKADWIIGRGLFLPGIKGVGLRSMSDPGTAYDDPALGGKDPQPADMQHYVHTTEDDGGVHLNSGIPNRAFYLAARALGGNAWEKAGHVWYEALQALHENAGFSDAAKATIAAAADLYGAGEADHVRGAWHQVGVDVKAKRRAA